MPNLHRVTSRTSSDVVRPFVLLEVLVRVGEIQAEPGDSVSALQLGGEYQTGHSFVYLS